MTIFFKIFANFCILPDHSCLGDNAFEACHVGVWTTLWHFSLIFWLYLEIFGYFWLVTLGYFALKLLNYFMLDCSYPGDKAFEASHVGIWTFPGQKKRVRSNMTQLEAADRRQRTEF